MHCARRGEILLEFVDLNFERFRLDRFIQNTCSDSRIALDVDRPLFAFAGLWTPWRGVRGPRSAPIEGEHELFGFLTTEASAVVAPIHPKAILLLFQAHADDALSI